jgi:catechol 1,2-dioxygenase
MRRPPTSSAAAALAGLAVVLAAFTPPAASETGGPTPDVGAGPNHRPGAPFRAKLSPPWAPGTTLVLRGRVVDAATGEGIAGAVLDAYHADHEGRYDADGFDYRARITADEKGAYELETIVPSNYGPPPHIHFIVTHPDYRTLRTEMRFRDAEHATNDRPELTPKLEKRSREGRTWEEGTFDVALVHR